MKFLALKLVFALFLSILSTSSIAATLINRADFGVNAVEFGFDTIVGDDDPTDGNFTALGGEVRGSGDTNFSDQGIDLPLAYLSKPDNFTFTFAESVSAFGFNFASSEEAEYALVIADINDNILGFVSLDPDILSPCIGTAAFVCGFVGLNVNSNQISQAFFIDQDQSGFVTTIDNVIYETVPTPGILWLFSTGFLGLYWSRKQNLS